MAASLASLIVDWRLQHKTAEQNNSTQGQWSFSAKDINRKNVNLDIT
jgi:hypothetical protein